MNFSPTDGDLKFFAGGAPHRQWWRRRRRQRVATDYNPYHEPAGSPEGGQFTSGTGGGGEGIFGGKGYTSPGSQPSHVDHFASHKLSGDPEATGKEIAKHLPSKKPDHTKADRRLFENAAASHMARTSGITSRNASTKLAYHIAAAAGYSHAEANKMAPKIAENYRYQKGYQLSSFAATSMSGDRDEFSYRLFDEP